MIAITVDGISLSFGTTQILESVSFSLDETDRLGVIGVNGSGKSTLFKIITGELEASSGNVYIYRRERLSGYSSRTTLFWSFRTRTGNQARSR